MARLFKSHIINCALQHFVQVDVDTTTKKQIPDSTLEQQFTCWHTDLATFSKIYSIF